MPRKKPEKPTTDIVPAENTGSPRPGPAGNDIYCTLIETLPQSIFYKDKDLVYVSCNGNYARNLKIGNDEIAVKQIMIFIPGK